MVMIVVSSIGTRIQAVRSAPWCAGPPAGKPGGGRIGRRAAPGMRQHPVVDAVRLRVGNRDGLTGAEFATFQEVSCLEIAMWTPEDRVLVGDYGLSQK